LEREGTPVQLIESVFVDDGSIDESAAVLDRLEAEHQWIHVIHLSRNFGQHPATIAGILHTSGDWVATLDEDLQHPPEHVMSLLREAVCNRCDIVYGKGSEAIHESYFRDGSSRLYKAIVGKMTGNPHIWKFSSFRMLRGSVARAAAALSTHNTYLDIALSWFTDRIGTLSLPLQDVRFISRGQSGYRLSSLLSHAGRMLASTEIKMLRVGAVIGVATLLLSLCMSGVVLVQKIWFPESIQVKGWASLILSILFFGGLTSVLAGIALEYLSGFRLHMLGRPAYFVIDRTKDQLLLQFLEKKKGA
jgi:glycosyltransferase involved in cell wall biosynthesis